MSGKAKLSAVESPAGGVVWEDLPPIKNHGIGQFSYVELLSALLERPGEWARIRTYDKRGQAANARTQLKRGFYRIPAGKFDYAVRTIDRGGFALYARYLGPEVE